MKEQFSVKSKKELELLDPESTDIAVDNLIHRYENRPHQMENYCLADFASKVNICQNTKPPSGFSSKSSTVICFFYKILFIGEEKKTE